MGRAGLGGVWAALGRLVLQPRSVSKIVVIGIVVVTMGLPAVANAASPDRAPSASTTAGGSRPDSAPQAAAPPSTSHSSATPVTVPSGLRATPTETAAPAPVATGPRSTAPPVTHATPSRTSVIQRASRAHRAHARARDHRPRAAHRPHPHPAPVALRLGLPSLAPLNLVAASRQTQPNGVGLLLSSIALGMLVVASLSLLRQLRRLHGGSWEGSAR